MKTHDYVQGTTEWRQARLGKVTASRMGDLVAKTKTGYGASRANLMAELIAERLTGIASEGYINGAMQHGIDTEAEARAAYEFYQGVEVQQVGFIEHPTIGSSGASPDGLIAGSRGLLEIKCPNTNTHIETLLTGAVPEKYALQMQWQMECADGEWCDFVSYDPRMPENLRLFVKRVNRDNEKIKEMEIAVTTFIKEMLDKIQKLSEIGK